MENNFHVDFATSLMMYNLGIKDRKLQSSTLQTVQYLDNMRQELGDILVTNAIDRQQRRELEQPSTTHFLHKNYLKMRALYHHSEDLDERRLPKILQQDVEVELGRSPVSKADFTSKYDKLKENTMLQKEFK